MLSIVRKSSFPFVMIGIMLSLLAAAPSLINPIGRKAIIAKDKNTATRKITIIVTATTNIIIADPTMMIAASAR